MNAAMCSVVWSEHVVERRRAEVFALNDWPPSAMHEGLLIGAWKAYESEMPSLIGAAVRNGHVPDQMYGHWQIVTREVVCAYGRAQGGNKAEEHELETFLNSQAPGAAMSWLDLMDICDRAFHSPHLDSAALDAVGEEGWSRVYEALREHFNAAAQ